MTKLFQNIISPDDNSFILVKNKLKNWKYPFDFENEILFLDDLIIYKIPFPLIRFGNGENSIINEENLLAKIDKWHWNFTNKIFQGSIIESSSIFMNNNNFTHERIRLRSLN